MNNLFEKYFGSQNAAAQTNRRTAIGVGITVAAIGAGLWYDAQNAKSTPKEGAEQLLNGKTSEEADNQNLVADLKLIREDNRQMQQQVKQLLEQQGKPASEIDQSAIDRAVAEAMAKNQTNLNSAPSFGEGQGGGMAAPPLAEGIAPENQAASSTTPGFNSGTETHADGNTADNGNSGLRKRGGKTREQSATQATDNQSYLPPGSILSYKLLTGVNAPTNIASDSKNPPVILLTIKGLALLPNGYRADIGDCFVLGPVYGQYMDSRAVARTKKISCIRDDGKAVEANIVGQINGEDGKPGWYGRTASRTGKALAGLARTGFYQTLGNIGGGVANGLNFNVGGSSSNGTARTQINLGGMAGQSVARNAETAFDKMANLYEKFGNEAIPVIEIEPGRTGEIILEEGLTLDFSKEVK
ncbi:TrbI/VirB10 family protein [Neisseria sp.]|uniref:TrbI/VirB10 family protein n=1 Tax=Neisseria sp. TaxID=192066 RepID=UPI0035A12792